MFKKIKNYLLQKRTQRQLKKLRIKQVVEMVQAYSQTLQGALKSLSYSNGGETDDE